MLRCAPTRRIDAAAPAGPRGGGGGAGSPFAKQRLAEGIIANRGFSQPDAYIEAERLLARLDRGLAAIPAKQRIIDGRMADFTRLSEQRYRYQTEIRGRRPEQVKAYRPSVDHGTPVILCDLADRARVAISERGGRARFGADSLYRPRRARPLQICRSWRCRSARTRSMRRPLSASEIFMRLHRNGRVGSSRNTCPRREHAFHRRDAVAQ